MFFLNKQSKTNITKVSFKKIYRIKLKKQVKTLVLLIKKGYGKLLLIHIMGFIEYPQILSFST